MNNIKTITVNGVTYTIEDGRITGLSGAHGQLVNIIEPDENGKCKISLWSLTDGVYSVPNGTIIYSDDALSGQNYLLNGSGILTVGTSADGAYRIGTFNYSTTDGTMYKRTFSTSGGTSFISVATINFAKLTRRDTANTWTGIQTFKAQPVITAEMPSADDSSTTVPTTAWVQRAIENAGGGDSGGFLIFNIAYDSADSVMRSDKTYDEIYSALQSGIVPIGIVDDSEFSELPRKQPGFVFYDHIEGVLYCGRYGCYSGDTWA